MLVLAGTAGQVFAGTADEVTTEVGYQALADMSLEELVAMDVFKAANLLPEQPAKAPGTVYSFGQDDFRRFGVRRLDELLEFVPGMQVNQYRKRHRSIWARGVIERYNDKFVMLIDGVRRQQLYYGHFSAGEELPLEYVEKVEIILGPASSLYGANAFSGLISITTRDFASKPELTLSQEFGNHERSKTTMHYNSASWQVFGSYLDQEAPFSDNRLSFVGDDVVQPLDESYQNISVKGQLLPGLTLMADYRESDTPFVFIPPTQDAYIEGEAWSVALNYEVGTFEEGRLEANIYYQDDKVLEYEREQLTGTLGYEEHQNAVMSGATVTGFKRFGDHTLALGTTWKHERAEKMSYTRSFSYNRGFFPEEYGELLTEPHISNDDYALFLQDVWALSETLKVTVGLRQDHFERFDDYFNYRAALVYSPAVQHTWKLLYGTAIRTPTLREYLKVLENTSFMQPELDAETIDSVEASYRYAEGDWDAGVTLYHNTLHDFIRETPTPDGFDEYFANSSSEVVVQGVEALISRSFGDRLAVRLGVAYVDFDVNNIQATFHDMPYVAEWTGSLNLDYAINDQHQVGLSVISNSNRRDLNGIARDDADSFALLNAHVSGHLWGNVDYQVGADNLLDERVMDVAADFGTQYNVEKSRRQVWLKLTWTPDL
ncbi:TonB-dependent receptor domain-containing protein [Pseudomaricurvus sp. HS19]|uniref:TonB-dependent receptor plug domain-containing protein n=1 Tax=Pseudomaricurvus sp. HS19 TaxID=2692626 RepID=UPI00136F036E|nr:TonB-dependent receptor [Pseudomaricurvus sp. HS19]